jgi:hypothetical protein
LEAEIGEKSCEAAVVESQAKDGRSGVREAKATEISGTPAKQRSGTIAQKYQAEDGRSGVREAKAHMATATPTRQQSG